MEVFYDKTLDIRARGTEYHLQYQGNEVHDITLIAHLSPLQ